MRLALAVPVLNEEKSLVSQIEKLLEYLDSYPELFRGVNVVIADNGSSDQTQALGTHLSAKHQRVSYVRTSQPGVGKALRTAWASEDTEFIGFMDLDFSTDLSHLVEVSRILRNNEADFVYGTRWTKDSHVSGRSLTRSVSSFVFNALVRLVFQVRVTDAMCGFKFLTRSKLSELELKGARNDKWFFGTELVVLGHIIGLRMFEMPVRWTDDHDSKVRIIHLAVEYIRAMKNLRSSINRWRS
jgi:glycosyltransferase involved in cell wall biosynthesis